MSDSLSLSLSLYPLSLSLFLSPSLSHNIPDTRVRKHTHINTQETVENVNVSLGHQHGERPLLKLTW